MTATKSKDGKLRFDALIRHRVGAAELEAAAVDWFLEQENKAFAEMSRAGLIAHLRQLLYRQGTEFGMRVGDRVRDFAESEAYSVGLSAGNLWEGAGALVRRLFPELES